MASIGNTYPTCGPTPNTRLHGQTDDAIRDLQNPYVVLRPHFFMQNLLSQRASIADQFAPPVPLAELNTSSTEGDPALSPDFRHILFASNRSGRFEIYEAWR